MADTDSLPELPTCPDCGVNWPDVIQVSTCPSCAYTATKSDSAALDAIDEVTAST
jgi:hypothetical protein